jgi:hypothetical protein
MSPVFGLTNLTRFFLPRGDKSAGESKYLGEADGLEDRLTRPWYSSPLIYPYYQLNDANRTRRHQNLYVQTCSGWMHGAFRLCKSSQR